MAIAGRVGSRDFSRDALLRIQYCIAWMRLRTSGPLNPIRGDDTRSSAVASIVAGAAAKKDDGPSRSVGTLDDSNDLDDKEEDNNIVAPPKWYACRRMLNVLWECGQFCLSIGKLICLRLDAISLLLLYF